MSTHEKRMPKYQAIYIDLKEKIAEGIYVPGERLPSERELTEQYGVERITVRRSLENLQNDGLIQKQPGIGSIVLAPSRLGTKAESARSILFILPRTPQNTDRISEPFYGKLFYRVERECGKRGYTTVYTTLGNFADVQRICAIGGVAGMMLVSHIDKDFRNALIQTGLPLIVVNQRADGLPSIMIDNVQGAQAAVKHLLGKGHKRIAAISGPEDNINARQRLIGMQLSLSEAGLSLSAAVRYSAEWSMAGGAAAMKELLSVQPLPTAVFGFSDLLALGAMEEIRARGLRMPEDIAVIGFDNIDRAALSTPPLTTIGTDIDLTGRLAVKTLFELIDSDVPPVVTMVPTTLVERQST